jgi:hypothetical protein
MKRMLNRFNDFLLHSLPHLRQLRYSNLHRHSLDDTLLGGACHQLTYLSISRAFFSSARVNYFPRFLSLKELVLFQVTLIGVRAFFNFFENTPALESLTVQRMKFRALSISTIEELCYKPLDPISLSHVRKLRMDCDVPSACICLRGMPDPLNHFMVTLARSEAHFIDRNQSCRPYVAYYSKIFNRISIFWELRTGHKEIPLAQFYHSNPTGSASVSSCVEFGK